MALPTLTAEERQQALARAREVRSERSAALAGLTSGTVTLADFLASDDEVIRKTRVRAAVLALRGVGPKRADEALAAAKVARTRTARVGGLGRNQRDALLEFFTAA